MGAGLEAFRVKFDSIKQTVGADCSDLFSYSDACMAGDVCNNDQWCPVGITWMVDGFDEILAKAGVSQELFGVCKHFLERGTPLSQVESGDMMCGYLMNSEIREIASALDGIDRAGLESYFISGLEQIESWFRHCLEQGQDLVTFANA